VKGFPRPFRIELESWRRDRSPSAAGLPTGRRGGGRDGRASFASSARRRQRRSVRLSGISVPARPVWITALPSPSARGGKRTTLSPSPSEQCQVLEAFARRGTVCVSTELPFAVVERPPACAERCRGCRFLPDVGAEGNPYSMLRSFQQFPAATIVGQLRARSPRCTRWRVERRLPLSFGLEARRPRQRRPTVSA